MLYILEERHMSRGVEEYLLAVEAEKKLKEITKNKITKTPKPKDDWVMAW